MYSSITRGGSRARPAYICTSCLTSILGHGEVQLPGSISDCQPFSSSATVHARIRESRKRPTGAAISNSTEALSALKQSLLDDISPPAKKAKVVKTPKTSNTTKPGAKSTESKKALDYEKHGKKEIAVNSGKPKVKATYTNKNTNDARVSKKVVAGENAESVQTVEKAKPKPKSKKTLATKEGKDTKPILRANKKPKSKAPNPTKAVPGNGETAPKINRKSGPVGDGKSPKKPVRKGLGLKITRRLLFARKAPLPPRSVQPYMGGTVRRVAKKVGDAKGSELVRQVATSGLSSNYRLPTLEDHIRRAGADATRAALVKVIESGHLSPNATMDAVRDLRASLVKRVPSGPSKVEITPGSLPGPVPVGQHLYTAMKAFESFKDGVQGRPLRAGGRVRIPTRKPVPADSRPRPLSPPNTQDKNEQLGAKFSRPAKTVRTGPMKGKGFAVKSVTADELNLVPIEKQQAPVPGLAYGLERVLFNPGVYHLQDPRSRVFNFDPYLQTIMPLAEFDFNALKQYVTSSRDESLLGIAREESKKYTGSTSSMTAALAHFHFLLSQWRPINAGILSQNFPVDFNSFTGLQRGPTAVFLRHKNGVYAIDADKEYDTANVLSMLGKSMEKLLTLPTADFEKYRRENSDQISEEERNEAETFHYTTIGDFLLRSQLDAYDPRLPGTGMFDLKTRAVVSIRMDVKEYEQGMGYEIRGRHGEYESYEREYYDMIRAAFLKYSLQVRMGRMDGIFVAFHNTERIFGFQYISLPEMDYALHGTEDTTIGDGEFKLSLDLLNKVLDRATAKYPEKSLRLHFETRGDETPFMYIFAEPMEDPQIDEIQATNRAEVLNFEQSVLGLGPKTPEELLDEKKNAEWEVLREKVEASMQQDELGIPEARALAEDHIQASEYWDELSPDDKERRIIELLKTFSFSDAQWAEHDESVVVDDGEEDDEADMTEEDENEDEEAQEEDEGEEEDETNDEEDIEEEIEEEEIEEEVNEVVANETDAQGSEKTSDSGTANDVSEAEVEAMEAEIENGDVGSDQAEDAMTEQESEHARTDASELVGDEEQFPDPAQENTDDRKGPETSDEIDFETPEHTSPINPTQKSKETPRELFAMTLTIRNLVNGKYVERPEKLSAEDKWTVEYALVNIADTRSRVIYEACKKRRSSVLNSSQREATPWNNAYLKTLQDLSEKGRAWRKNQDKIEAEAGLKILDVKDEQENNGLWTEGKKE